MICTLVRKVKMMKSFKIYMIDSILQDFSNRNNKLKSKHKQDLNQMLRCINKSFKKASFIDTCVARSTNKIYKKLTNLTIHCKV